MFAPKHRTINLCIESSMLQPLAIQPNPQSTCAFAEGLFAALQNVANRLANSSVLKTARSVFEWGQPTSRMRTGVGDNDLVRIGVDDEVGIVRDHDYLAFGLGRDKQGDQLLEHRFGIQVLLWLIDDEWPIVSIVQCQVEKEKYDSPRSRRQFADIHSVIDYFVPHRDVIGGEKPVRELLQPATKLCLLILAKGGLAQKIAHV